MPLLTVMAASQTLLILLPHQLYRWPALWQGVDAIWLAEEHLFFGQYRFHKQKLVLHRASMQLHAGWLRGQGMQVRYWEHATSDTDLRTLLRQAGADGFRVVRMADPVDDWLERRARKTCAELGLVLEWIASPNFLNTPEQGDEYFSGLRTYFQTDFYIEQRRRRRLLLEPDGKPLGGKWTFDTDNRKRYPKGSRPPQPSWPTPLPEVAEAILHIEKHYSEHYGTTADFRYPVTHEAAEAWLKDFLLHRFAAFGVYEDAMVAGEQVLHHSVLTPALNIGLLSPQQVLDAAVRHAEQHDIPLNSLEGFVRQVAGWREFIRIVYHREGRRQRTANFWGFTRKIPKSFWEGTTGIGPVDTVIRKAIGTGYNHHIERLMVLGNFFLLCEFDPDEVYRWFMEMYVDAYDWVMVPNVYGMTQFADGGLMTTKPYISGSNYLMKMGDWKPGPWQAVWDGLFWRFMHVHRDFFTRNPRLGMLVKTFDKMSASKQQEHLSNAERFLLQLDTI